MRLTLLLALQVPEFNTHPLTSPPFLLHSQGPGDHQADLGCRPATQ